VAAASAPNVSRIDNVIRAHDRRTAFDDMRLGDAVSRSIGP